MNNEFKNIAEVEVTACGETHTLCSNESTVKKVVVRVEKMADRECVFEGDCIVYTVKICNESSVLINDPIFCDDIPNGLSYVAGTFEVNGKPETPEREPFGNRISFKLKHLTPNSETVICFQVKAD